MGFGAALKDSYDNDPDLLSHVTNEDLRAFGMIPEFLGRLPVNVTLKGLDKDMMIRILKEPKNAILRQYEKLLALDEVKLVFEEDALSWIAEEALKRGTGARASEPFWKSLCLISCMRYQKTRISGLWWSQGLIWRKREVPDPGKRRIK